MTAAIKRSLIPCPVISSPCEDFGWIIKDDLIQIQWMLWKPVPNKLIELISCSCRKSKCLSNQFACRLHGRPYTDLFNCNSCGNQSEDISDDIFDRNQWRWRWNNGEWVKIWKWIIVIIIVVIIIVIIIIIIIIIITFVVYKEY